MFCMKKGGIPMQKKKLKKLLHTRKGLQYEEKTDYEVDDRLQLNYVSINQIKSDGMTTSFNKIRRENTKNVLNKYNHPDSQHIRLKPYYDSGIWLHWLGVLSDLTLPNTTNNLNGELLLDKLTTGDNKELLDYHVWLNLKNVKYIKSQNQKLGIGDIVQGFSKIKRYNGNKYGLDTTVIEKAGIFKGVDKPDILVSNYDRQDDWVIEIENSTSSMRAWENYQESQDKTDLEKEPGHVEVRYQPSRYKKYRDRLQETERETSEEVLPLINEKETEYHAEVEKVYISRNNKINRPRNQPKLQLKRITNPHGRLIMPIVDLPYIDEAKKMGEVEPEDIVVFQSKANDVMPNSFGYMNNFRVVTKPPKHPYIELPENPNTFLGYIMWIHPDENRIPELVLNYQTWAISHGIHVDKIKNQLASLAPVRPITESELAEKLGISTARIENAVQQGVVKTYESDGIRMYDANAWQTFIDLLSAQDLRSVEAVKEKYTLYSTDDIAHLVDRPLDEVRDRIRKSNYDPLNGWHYKINLYGPNVYKMFKSRIVAKKLVPPRQRVKVHKEIPRDENYVKKFAPELTSKPEMKPVSPNLPVPQIVPKQEKQEVPVAVNTKDQRKEETAAPEVKKLQNVSAVVENKADTISIQVETFDAKYLNTEFKNMSEASHYIESTAAQKWTNHFLHVKNYETGKLEMISTKAVINVKAIE